MKISGFVTRYMKVLALLPVLSCNQPPEKKVAEHRVQADSVKPVLRGDTLPNGKILFDTRDSAMVYYYKEVVGTDTLKGGGITCYGVDDSMRYFYYRVGDKLYLLNQSSKYQSPWSLGQLEEDHEDFFLTRIDNGNGCPVSYELFDKSDGHNILGNSIEAVDFTWQKDTLFMLYDNGSRGRKADSIILVNAQTGRREGYRLPDGLPEYCSIQIDKLKKRSLAILFSGYVGKVFERSKIYERSGR